MRTTLSPLFLLLLCWGLTGLVAAYTLAQLGDLDLVQTFMRREGISISVFEATGLWWILLGVTAYAIGDLAARIGKGRRQVPPSLIDVNRAAQLTFLANLLLLGVTALWILTAAAQVGGLTALAANVYMDSLTTRDLLLENKLFTGMRLFYAALPATACLAAALLATGRLRGQGRRIMVMTLLINTCALFILPIVMSQRLLLLQLLLSAYIAACLVRGRLFGLHWLGLGVVLFLGLWIAREAITNPIIQRSAYDIASQKLAFYVVNDMFNAFAPLTQTIQHTFGGMTLEGVMFLTFTDGYFLNLLAPRLAALDVVIGGGEFPFFTAAYVDFGAIGGAAFILIVGFVLRRVFVRAHQSLGWAAVYAQIGAALLFSSHSVYFTHQNFFFSLALIGTIVALSRKKPVVVPDLARRGPVFRTCREVRPLPPPLPDSLMRHMAVFRSRYRATADDQTRRKKETAHERA
ncbi:MAG: O-antigen polymerase [Pseudomonadota bacterium]